MAVSDSFVTKRPSADGGFRLTIPAEQRHFIIFSLWCGTTFVQFPRDELLLYPLALYYAWAVWDDQKRIAPLLAKAWVILLFPLWCLISPIWAVTPGNALKQAVYLLLTMMICFHVAATMRPRRILHSLLLSSGVIGIINLVYAVVSGDMNTGIFEQKNFMGKYMVVLWAIATAVLLDRRSAQWIRLMALGLAVIACAMALVSQSLTALLLVCATGAINLFGAVFFLGGFFRPGRIAMACLGIAAAAAVAAVVLPSLQTNPAILVLDSFGKDTTLTGRTVLWDHAQRQIEEQPLLGVGAGGFWRYHASPLIQKIYEDFHKFPSDHFNFHSSYYEIAVHQGLIGVALAGLALAWALGHAIRAALLIGTLPQVYFFTQSLTVVVRAGTEADFFKPFVLFHMIFWIGALSAVQIGLQARAGNARCGTLP